MWALGLPVWGSHLQGDKLLAIYPSEPLACSIYGNTTDTSEIQADPLSSPQKATGGGGGDLHPRSSINIKYVGSSEGIIQPPNRKIISVSSASSPPACASIPNLIINPVTHQFFILTTASGRVFEHPVPQISVTLPFSHRFSSCPSVLLRNS